MLSRLSQSVEAASRGKLFWAALATLAAVQLLALYMLCSHQMRMAQARQTEAEVQRLAVNDCLRYLANSTIGSCTGNASAGADAALQGSGTPGSAASAVQVNYASWR